ncbi:MAG: hypothetical protein Q4D60_09140 [Eubacteriales bacterium]|nr:hypothetical protein [Eubacteriales bacterium]
MTQREYDALKKRGRQEQEKISHSAFFRIRLLLALAVLFFFAGPGQRWLSEEEKEQISLVLEENRGREAWRESLLEAAANLSQISSYD